MPNFTAQVRTSYRDVPGMVLSLVREDIVEDVRNPGFVLKWRNRAPGLPSKPYLRLPGDPAPTYLGGRFSDPTQTVQAQQPTLALTGPGEQRCQFDRSRSTFLQTEMLVDELPDPAGPAQAWTIGYQFEKGGDASVNQYIVKTDGVTSLQLIRLNGAARAAYAAGGTWNLAADHPDGTFMVAQDDWLQDNVSLAPTGPGPATTSVAAGIRLNIGTFSDSFGFLDGTLDGLHIWACDLSPLTRDFVWQTLDADGNDYSSGPNNRAPMLLRTWTDLTGDPALDQFDRLRPSRGFPHRYVLADLQSTALHRIQVAAAVDGIVLPDADLGGDLFTYNWLEVPGPPVVIPTIFQDAGWSAVADCRLNQEGHYTLGITRENGGTVIVHFDVSLP